MIESDIQNAGKRVEYQFSDLYFCDNWFPKAF